MHTPCCRRAYVNTPCVHACSSSSNPTVFIRPFQQREACAVTQGLSTPVWATEQGRGAGRTCASRNLAPGPSTASPAPSRSSALQVSGPAPPRPRPLTSAGSLGPTQEKGVGAGFQCSVFWQKEDKILLLSSRSSSNLQPTVLAQTSETFFQAPRPLHQQGTPKHSLEGVYSLPNSRQIVFRTLHFQQTSSSQHCSRTQSFLPRYKQTNPWCTPGLTLAVRPSPAAPYPAPAQQQGL